MAPKTKKGLKSPQKRKRPVGVTASHRLAPPRSKLQQPNHHHNNNNNNNTRNSIVTNPIQHLTAASARTAESLKALDVGLSSPKSWERTTVSRAGDTASLPPPPPYTKRSSLVAAATHSPHAQKQHPQQYSAKKKKPSKSYGLTSSGTFSQKQLFKEMVADLQDCFENIDQDDNRAAVVKERQRIWERRMEVQHCGINPSDVKKQFHKARRALAQQLEQHETKTVPKAGGENKTGTTTRSSSPVHTANSIYKRSPLPNIDLEPILREFDSLERSTIQSMINLCSDKIRRLATIDEESIVVECLKDARRDAKELHATLSKTDRKRFWTCAKQCCIKLYDLPYIAKNKKEEDGDEDASNDRRDDNDGANAAPAQEGEDAEAKNVTDDDDAVNKVPDNVTQDLYEEASVDIMKKLLADRSAPLQSLLAENESHWKQRYKTEMDRYEVKKDDAGQQLQDFWMRVCKRLEFEYAQSLPSLEPIDWDFFFVGAGSSPEKAARYLKYADWTILPPVDEVDC